MSTVSTPPDTPAAMYTVGIAIIIGVDEVVVFTVAEV